MPDEQNEQSPTQTTNLNEYQAGQALIAARKDLAAAERTFDVTRNQHVDAGKAVDAARRRLHDADQTLAKLHAEAVAR